MGTQEFRYLNLRPNRQMAHLFGLNSILTFLASSVQIAVILCSSQTLDEINIKSSLYKVGQIK